MKYKFISDGNWTADIKAPDTVDDGFGGLNGLVDVNVLGAGGDGAAASGPKIKFLTWSMLGAQAKFGLADDTKGLQSAGLNLKSYVKFAGDVLPSVPVYVEIAVAEKDTFENLYKKDSLEWGDGLKNLAADLIMDPVAYFNGNEANLTYLGHFKFGISSDYVNWTTGYKYAKLPPHQINDWVTVDKEWEAGYSAVGGFNYFELGHKLQQLGPVTLKAALAPNRSADRAGNQYGFFGWVNASVGPMATVDFQYNGAYGKTFDSIFGNIYEADYILGYKGIFGPVTVVANGLLNFYGDGDVSYSDEGELVKSKYTPFSLSTDVKETTSKPENKIDDIAFKAYVNYANDTISATVGARARGAQAGLMYVEEGADDHTNISDQLGDLNHMRFWADVNANVTTALNIGLNPYLEMVLNKEVKTSPFADKDGMKIYAKPYFALDLDEAFYVPGKLDGYAEFNYFTKEADKVSSVIGNNQFRIEAAGIKYSMELSGVVKGIEAIYCYDDTNGDKLFNSVISTIKFDKDYNVQAGFGIRTKNSESTVEINNPFGFFVGATKKLPVLAKPTAYLQFMYAMDPYNKFGDGPTAYKLDDYKLKNGVSNYENDMAVRIGLHWDL